MAPVMAKSLAEVELEPVGNEVQLCLLECLGGWVVVGVGALVVVGAR